jgi:hypothetical protein
VHNFIQVRDPLDLDDFEGMEDSQQGADVGELALGPPHAVERVQAQERRDRIAEAM